MNEFWFKWEMSRGHSRTVILNYGGSMRREDYAMLYNRHREAMEWCLENYFRVRLTQNILEITFSDQDELLAFLLRFG